MRNKAAPTRAGKKSRKLAEQQSARGAQLNMEAQEEYRLNKPKFEKLTARGEKQKGVLRDLENKSNRLMFLTGPAGTGKTFLPTSYAAEQLLAGQIERIIITRPMVGCDEDMGFLPGTEEEKFKAWVEPFLEILEGKLGKRRVEFYREHDIIVAKPLMMMRGATFRNAFVILDESQNTTTGQMKMFLTRIGQGSRVVINGDVEQSDLPANRPNGLSEAMKLFEHSSVAALHTFTEDDITRDPLVREVVKAYRRKYQRPTQEQGVQEILDEINEKVLIRPVPAQKSRLARLVSGLKKVFAQPVPSM